MCICLWREKLNFHIYPSSQKWGELSTTLSCHLLQVVIYHSVMSFAASCHLPLCHVICCKLSSTTLSCHLLQVVIYHSVMSFAASCHLPLCHVIFCKLSSTTLSCHLLQVVIYHSVMSFASCQYRMLRC